MTIKIHLVCIGLAAAVAAVPASAEDKKPTSGKDRDINVVRCYERAQTTQQFELCDWLTKVADGQPTAWLEFYGMGWR
jgi:hypothetical protein